MSSPERTTESTVERSVLLDAGVDEVLEALSSPDLLSAWLGEWSEPGHDGDTATVVTDDGTTRRVERLETPGDAHEVSWRWSPTGGSTSWSNVRFTVTTDGDRTRLTVVESMPAPSKVVASASATAPAVPWVGCLMALGAVLALGSLVAV